MHRSPDHPRHRRGARGDPRERRIVLRDRLGKERDAEPGDARGVERACAVRAQDDPRTVAAGLHPRVLEREVARAREHQHVVSSQRALRVGRRAVRVEVRARRIETQRDVRESLAHDVVLARAREPKRDVRLAPGEAHHLVRAAQLERDVRIERAEGRELRRDEARGQHLRRGHAHGAGELLVRAAQLPLDRERLALHALRVGHQAQPGRGRRKAVGRAIEELAADALLERAEAAADRRRVDAERGGRARERPRALHGEEVAEVVPVDHVSLTVAPLAIAGHCESAASSCNLAAGRARAPAAYRGRRRLRR